MHDFVLVVLQAFFAIVLLITVGIGANYIGEILTKK